MYDTHFLFLIFAPPLVGKWARPSNASKGLGPPNTTKQLSQWVDLLGYLLPGIYNAYENLGGTPPPF